MMSHSLYFIIHVKPDIDSDVSLSAVTNIILYSDKRCRYSLEVVHKGHLQNNTCFPTFPLVRFSPHLPILPLADVLI